MSAYRTAALMQRADRSGRTVIHRNFPGRVHPEAQELFAQRGRSPVYRPGPMWHGPVLEDGQDPALALLTPRESKGLAVRALRAAVLILAVLVLSPVLPGLIT